MKKKKTRKMKATKKTMKVKRRGKKKDPALRADEVYRSIFKDISDGRAKRNRRYSARTLLELLIIGQFCGAKKFASLATYIKMNRDKVTKFIKLPPGCTPSRDTFRRLLAGIPPWQLTRVLERVGRRLRKKAVGSGLLAIDGKAIRNSSFSTSKCVKMVSAFHTGLQIAISHEPVPEGKGEQDAIKALLPRLQIEGHTVTIDAIGCTGAITGQITHLGGNYIISLKGNQRRLYERAKKLLATPPEGADARCVVQSGEGERLVVRTCTVVPVPEDAAFECTLKGVKTLICVEKEETRKGQRVCSRRYFVSSLELKASEFEKLVREHWQIENQLHWRLDVIAQEDKACIRKRNIAINMSTIRKIAFSLAKEACSDMTNGECAAHFLGDVERAMPLLVA